MANDSEAPLALLSQTLESRAPPFNPVVASLQEIEGLPSKGFFYNAAAISVFGGRVALLGRHIEECGAPDQPDIGTLDLALLERGRVVQYTTMWTPQPPGEGGTLPSGDLLEDPRSILLPDGKLILGFTRLLQKDGHYIPYPAFAFTSVKNLLAGVFPSTSHILKPGRIRQNDYLSAGKNATPLGGPGEQFMFRREGAAHEFLAFSLDQEGGAQNIQRIKPLWDRPPAWAKYKMGTTAPPVWFNEHEALLFIHGLRMDHEKYIYALGSARLFRDDKGKLSIDNVSKQPLLTPESFDGMFGKNVQLRPQERSAMYLCGAIVNYHPQTQEPITVTAYPSIGDTQIAEATFWIPPIISSWNRTEPHGRECVALAA